MSLIFNTNILMQKGYISCASLFSVNRTRKTYTNLMVNFTSLVHVNFIKQNIDLEEKKHIMVDLMRASPLQGSFNIKECQLKETKSFFGNTTIHRINDYETKKFSFSSYA